MIGETVSHYRITRLLGAGGMGVVYEAVDTWLERPVALKILPPEFTTSPDAKARFVHEAKAVSTLDHPNVCTVYEIDEADDGRMFLAMACYQGETLKERLARGPLDLPEAVDIARQVAEGLAQAHEREIIHRDIKPANIFITTDGLVKILDFGLAKLAGQTRLTRTGSTLGTAQYMSPEQALGNSTDQRTDLWSLGVVLYEMATGLRPFRADNEQAVVYGIINTEPSAPRDVDPDLPEAVSRLIVRCLEKDPQQRFRSVVQMLDELGVIMRDEGWVGSTASATVLLSSSKWGRSRIRRSAWRRIVPAAALVVVLAATATWLGTRSESIYTTELRLAVMPLDNLAHPDQDAVATGMTEVVYQLLDHASRQHPSMWVVPNRLVDYADLANHDLARTSFGVNRIVTGGLQRYEGGQVLLLQLRDAETRETVVEVRVPFDPRSSALGDSLPGAIARIIDFEPEWAGVQALYLPASGPAAADYLQGLGLLQRKDHAGALLPLERVITAAPDFAMGWCALGQNLWLAYAATGEQEFRDRSRERLSRAVDRAPGMWLLHLHLGEFYRRDGEAEAALEAYRAAIALDPGNPWVCDRMSRVLRYEARFAESVTVLRTAIAHYPDYFEAPRLLGRHYYFTDEYDAALVLLDRALALAPDDALTLNVTGAIFYERCDYTRAREYFEPAFSLTPNCDTCSNLGAALYHEGKFRDSASFYELSLEYCGEDDRVVWANWARALYWVDGGREESHLRFRKAIDLTRQEWNESPGDPELLGDLIEFHAMIGDAETTRRLIASADSLDSDDGDLLYMIGDAYELLGDRGAALRYLADAVRHGVPVARIRDTRELADLVEDPRFDRMVASESGEQETPAEPAR